MTTFDEIYRYLRAATRGLVENNILSNADVERRAQGLAEDINEIEFKHFKILALEEIECVINGKELTFPLATYGFGETRNAIDNARPNMSRKTMTHIRCMQGTGLDRGDLCYFARVSEIGRKMIPNLWLASSELRRDLRTPVKHLSTLNEVWWLSRWSTLDPQRVRHEMPLDSRSPSTVDWAFPLRGSTLVKDDELIVHLEVKELLSTLATKVYGDAEVTGNLFRGVEGKFRKSANNEINVIAATIMCEVDDNIDRIVTSRLEADELIDAVCIWSPVAGERTTLTRFNPRLAGDGIHKRAAIEHSLTPPRAEDAQIRSLRHPYPNFATLLGQSLN